MKYLLLCCLFLGTLSCKNTPDKRSTAAAYPDVKVAAAMRNVMWKGELGPAIQLDTIQTQEGLYGLGPLAYLQGELLINNGHKYVSRVTSDTSMQVQEEAGLTAPFFVYTTVQEWRSVALPDSVQDIPSLEAFVNQQTEDQKRPFAFRLEGTIQEGQIHIQNLPEGSQVSSPKEAHQGQINYSLQEEAVEIIGFFSTEHQGIFTHHDRFVHLHLITQDESQMGHLDKVRFRASEMSLFLPLQ